MRRGNEGNEGNESNDDKEVRGVRRVRGCQRVMSMDAVPRGAQWGCLIAPPTPAIRRLTGCGWCPAVNTVQLGASGVGRGPGA